MVDGLFFCATLTGRRRSHTPFVQAGAETFDTGAEAIEPDPGSSWEGRAARVFLLSDEMMSCCAAGTNGCLDLRRRASAFDGRVSAEWSRCPGSMAWRAGDSVAPLRRSSAGWMPARIGKLSAGNITRNKESACI